MSNDVKFFETPGTVFLGKTLYGTFPCLAVLASSSKFYSYLYKTKNLNKKFQRTAISWYHQKQVAVIICPIAPPSFFASQEDKYGDKMKK